MRKFGDQLRETAKVLLDIEGYEKSIDSYKPNDIFHIMPKLGELRSRCSLVHLYLEYYLDFILLQWALGNKDKEKNGDREIGACVEEVFAEADVYRKINLIKTHKLLPEDIIGKITHVNNLRNKFGHPHSYQNFKNLTAINKDPKLYLHELKTMLEALMGVVHYYNAKKEADIPKPPNKEYTEEEIKAALEIAKKESRKAKMEQNG